MRGGEGGDRGHAVAGCGAAAGDAGGRGPGSAAVAGGAHQGVLVLSAVFAGVVELEGAVGGVAEVWLPIT